MERSKQIKTANNQNVRDVLIKFMVRLAFPLRPKYGIRYGSGSLAWPRHRNCVPKYGIREGFASVSMPSQQKCVEITINIEVWSIPVRNVLIWLVNKQ